MDSNVIGRQGASTVGKLSLRGIGGPSGRLNLENPAVSLPRLALFTGLDLLPGDVMPPPGARLENAEENEHASSSAASSATATDDPVPWPENTSDERATEWVRRHDDAALAELGGERFERMRLESQAISESTTEISAVARRGRCLCNFWRAADHSRGV